MATMPSASLVSNSSVTSAASNVTSNLTSTMEPVITGAETALFVALQTVEKKVRNLEKRKVRYKTLQIKQRIIYYGSMIH